MAQIESSLSISSDDEKPEGWFAIIAAVPIETIRLVGMTWGLTRKSFSAKTFEKLTFGKGVEQYHGKSIVCGVSEFNATITQELLLQLARTLLKTTGADPVQLEMKFGGHLEMSEMMSNSQRASPGPMRGPVQETSTKSPLSIEPA